MMLNDDIDFAMIASFFIDNCSFGVGGGERGAGWKVGGRMWFNKYQLNKHQKYAPSSLYATNHLSGCLRILEFSQSRRLR